MVWLRNEEVQKKIFRLLKKVDANPCDEIYMSPVTLEHGFPLRIFVWNPIEKFKLKMKCLPHNLEFRSSAWTSSIMTEKNRLNPRLIYCLHYNILLIQKVYRCTTESSTTNSCLVTATNIELMDRFSEEAIKGFPYFVFPTVIYSQRMVDFIFEMVASGNNFQSTAQSIANLKAAEYSRAFENIEDDEMLESILLNSPTGGALEILFMDTYKSRMSSYKQLVYKTRPEIYVTVHHAVKLNKVVIKKHTEGKKPVRIKMVVFVAMDERHRIIAWHLLDEAAEQTELNEILAYLSSKSPSIEYIVTEDCCASEGLYENHFNKTPIKRDLNNIQKLFADVFADYQGKEADFKRFLGDFDSIFQDDDEDFNESETRTPNGDALICKLEKFIQKYQKFIMKMSDAAIQALDQFLKELKNHMMDGCLSGIRLEKNSEKKTDIQQLLNNNCLRGVDVVHYELLVPILTVLFYYHNSKQDGKKTWSKKSSAVFPPKQLALPLEPITSTVPLDGFVSSVESAFIEQTLALMQLWLESLSIVKAMCLHRSFSMEDMLRKDASSSSTSSVEDSQHAFNLQYNLNAFNLRSVPTAKDGDCCFRSILLQFYEKMDDVDEAMTAEFGILIGELKLDKDVEHDIEVLRALFVDRMKTDKKYEGFLLVNEESDVDAFTQRGVFASNIGDFVVDACCQILRVPITIIQSSGRLAVRTFLPHSYLCKEPLIIAYNVSENHYTSTKRRVEGEVNVEPTPAAPVTDHDYDQGTAVEIDKLLKCFCKAGCVGSGSTKKGCPCRLANQSCNVKCKCRQCKNDKAVRRMANGKCRCGGTVGASKAACVDIEGQRKCKCPCFKSKLGCQNCGCKGCGNTFGVNKTTEPEETVGPSPIKRRPSLHKLVKDDKQNSKASTAASGSPDWSLMGSWNDNETLAVYVVAEMIRFDRGQYCFDSICTLYDVVAKNTSIGSLSELPKTQQQILLKLKYLGVFQ